MLKTINLSSFGVRLCKRVEKNRALLKLYIKANQVVWLNHDSGTAATGRESPFA
jgi:hypothetical protein